MSSTIDPVTGYPLVSSGAIDYIPLNVQTFPFKDMNASGEPSRGSTYPDDIFSVMAHAAGYRQDNIAQDQVIYTDGKHAMLVSVVNQSGGGGGGSTPAMATYLDHFGNGNARQLSPGSYDLSCGINTPDIITSIDVFVQYVSGATLAAQSVNMLLQGQTNGSTNQVYVGSPFFGPSDAAGAVRHVQRDFYPSIDCVRSFGTGQTIYLTVAVNCTVILSFNVTGATVP